MSDSSLEKRITRLEDIEAIKQLKAKYCEACDDDHNQDKIIAIFAEDGVWEGGDLGKAEGHAAIRELFAGFERAIDFSQHNVMNPIIEITGTRATGIWYFMGPFTYNENADNKMLAIRYDDEYVKIDGQWKYQHLRAKVRMLAELAIV